MSGSARNVEAMAAGLAKYDASSSCIRHNAADAFPVHAAACHTLGGGNMLCVGLQFSQWGFWGIFGCIVVVAIGILCYGTYWGEWKLAAAAAGILLIFACARGAGSQLGEHRAATDAVRKQNQADCPRIAQLSRGLRMFSASQHCRCQWESNA